MTGVWKVNQEGMDQEISSGTFKILAVLLGSKTTLNYYFNEKV